MDDIAKLSYEEAYQQLEALVTRLESGALPLEDSVALYERGQWLSRHCQSLLEDAELTIKRIDERDDAAPGRGPELF